jgi:hypothetical protein
VSGVPPARRAEAQEDAMRSIKRREAIWSGLGLLAGAAASAVWASGAWAQQASPPAAPPQPGAPGLGGGMMGGGMMGGLALGRMGDPAGYLDALKGRLGITEAQAPAWNDYAQVVAGVAQQMQAIHSTVFQAMPTATWEERQKMMNDMFAARDQAHQTVAQAATDLMPHLTPQQRTLAQTSLPGLMPRGWGRGGGMGMGRGGMMGGPPAVAPAPAPAPAPAQ